MNNNPSAPGVCRNNLVRRFRKGFLIAAAIFALPLAAEAGTISVNTPKQCNEAAPAPVNCALLNPALGDGDGLCSLGEAIMAANTDAAFGGCAAGSGSDLIVLADPGPYKFIKVDNVDTNTCRGPNALPTIEGILRIDGSRQLIRSSEDFFRLAHLFRGITTWTNTTIENFNPGCDPVFCGDGIVEPFRGEECDAPDDGKTDGVGCSADCRLESCGDGTVDPGEQCDPAITSVPCSPTCRFMLSANPDRPFCGNGITDIGEGCDTGGVCVNSDGTPYAPANPCTSDGYCREVGEPTDYCAPQDDDGDGCSATCELEACGDGEVGPGEECDPGSACTESNKPCSTNADCNPGACSTTGISCQNDNECGNGFCNRTDFCQPLTSPDCDGSCRRQHCDRCYDGGAFLLGNEGDGDGGAPAILELHGATLISNATLTYPDPLTMGRSDGVGGAIAATQVGDSLPVVKIADTRFDFNASSVGGAVVALASNIEIGNSTFNANWTRMDLSPDSGGGGGGISGVGGALATVFSDVTIEQSAFHNNISDSLGGAVTSFCSGYDIYNSSFFQNRTDDLGGGFAVVMDPILCMGIVSDGGGNRVDKPTQGQGSFDNYEQVLVDATTEVYATDFEAAAATGHCSGDQSIPCDPFAQEDICHAFRNAGDCVADTNNGGGDGPLGGLFDDPQAFLDFLADKTFNIRSSTIAFNYARLQGGGMYVLDGGTLLPEVGASLMDTILADNIVRFPTDAPNCDGELISDDHNLFGDLTGCIVPFNTHDFIGDPGFLGPGDFIACDSADPTAGRQFCEPSCEGDGLDQASAGAPADDQLGTLRYLTDGTADIGAIERNDCTLCGNGIRELPFESCDDGGVCFVSGTPCTTTDQCDPLKKADLCVPKSGDGCSDECTIETCGNGTLDKDEECDDGQWCDDMKTRCLSTSDCVDINGNVIGSGACTPRNGDGCNRACLNEYCGDQTVNDGTLVCDAAGCVFTPTAEKCDDGNTVDNDFCDNNCQPPVCGDHVIEGREECEFDDGVTLPEGCFCHPTSCELECGGGGGETQPTCNLDGVTNAGEQCDDGNTSNDDDCLNDCTPNLCGDGFVDLNGPVTEECDDGNLNLNDACTTSCKKNVCGDGFTDFATEECDDGNAYNGDGCNVECKLESCGNDILDKHEECDDGQHCVSTDEAYNGIACLSVADCNGAPCLRRNGDGCNEQCRAESCGDGYWDEDGGDNAVGGGDDEECDDGNNIPGDGCFECQLESCGDGTKQPSEECDDGNTASGDGCSKLCREERCGDGIKDANGPDNVDNSGSGDDEQCDDGNQASGDGCSDTCKREVPPDCGDGTTDPGEECDDNNIVNGDGCNHNCEVEYCGDGFLDLNGGDNASGGGDDEQCEPPNGITCDVDCQLIPVTLPTCGDGNHDPGEQCDDGDLINDDECTDLCTLPRCDDGIVQVALGEECDDDNSFNGDDCTNACRWAICGDGVRHTETEGADEDVGDLEECDDGDTDNADDCTNDCTVPVCGGRDTLVSVHADEECEPAVPDSIPEDCLCSNFCELECTGEGGPFCGDGVKNGAEECDDGNHINGDACTDGCTIAECGDGITHTGVEDCDDNNSIDTDSCVDCNAAVCGDGVVWAGVEQCDDGNTADGDGCDSDCKNEEPTEPSGGNCGNEIEDPGEECDDGATNSNTVPDACRTTCKKASCGDDVVDSGEECDGSLGCTSSCKNDLCFAIKEDAKRVGTPGFSLQDYLKKYEIDPFSGLSPDPDVNKCQPLAALGGGSNEIDFTVPEAESLSGCSLRAEASPRTEIPAVLALITLLVLTLPVAPIVLSRRRRRNQT